MKELQERVAVLEEKQRQGDEKLDKVLTMQQSMMDQMTRYKGFIGGVTFLGSCLWAVVIFGKEWLTIKLGLK